MKFAQLSYWRVFRLVFVIFSLFLMGDVFYRWDGFRYYASFSEFLPSLGLVSIFWSSIALFVAFALWLSLSAISLFQAQGEWSKSQRFWSVIFICASLGAVTFITKRVIWLYAAIPLFVKITIVAGVIFTALFLTVVMLRLKVGTRLAVIQFLYTVVVVGVMFWIGNNTLLRGTQTSLMFKGAQLAGIVPLSLCLNWLLRNKSDVIQISITPLVWLFGVFVILSIPLVGYHAIWKESNKTITSEIALSSDTETKRPNIILVSFDALRASAMSVYGYKIDTTPFIKDWAKSATVFTRLEAESNNTYETTPSMMTGKRVWSHGMYHELNANKEELEESFPRVLKENGYYNIAFIVNHRAAVKKLGISNSFDIAPSYTEFIISQSLIEADHGYLYAMLFKYFNDKIRLYDWIIRRDFILGKLLKHTGDFFKNPYPVEKAFKRFLDIVDNSPKPYFAWIHLYPPHDPYLPPEPFMGMFDSSPLARSHGTQHLSETMTSDELRIVKARYDEFIRYCDEKFKDFIEELNAGNKLKNTIVILSSDHGESFEHGVISHGSGNLYEQLTNIPFIIREPGQREGRIVNEFVEQIDIPATVLDLVNIPVPSWMEGRSLMPLMRGNNMYPRPIFSMNLTKNMGRGNLITKGTIAVWEGDYKLIHYLTKDKSLLFNLKKDPEEMDNLIEREPEKAKHLLELINTNLERANDRIRADNQ